METHITELQTEIQRLTDERNNALAQITWLAGSINMILAPEGHNPIHVYEVRDRVNGFCTGWLEARASDHAIALERAGEQAAERIEQERSDRASYGDWEERQ